MTGGDDEFPCARCDAAPATREIVVTVGMGNDMVLDFTVLSCLPCEALALSGAEGFHGCMTGCNDALDYTPPKGMALIYTQNFTDDEDNDELPDPDNALIGSEAEVWRIFPKDKPLWWRR